MSTAAEQPHVPDYATPPRKRHRRVTNLAARGEPMVWLTGGMVGVAMVMIVGLLLFVGYFGLTTFWPRPLVKIQTADGTIVLGEPTRSESFVRSEPLEDGTFKRIEIDRTLYKTGNFDVTGVDFTWVETPTIARIDRPAGAFVIERVAWGNGYGEIESINIDGQTITDQEAAWAKFQQIHAGQRELYAKAKSIEKHEMGRVSKQQNDLRLRLRAIQLNYGEESEQARRELERQQPLREALDAELEQLRAETNAIYAQLAKSTITIRTPGGAILPADRAKPDEPLQVWQVVRMYPANQLGLGEKLSIYFGRWREYLFDDPREANTEGGVWPAIIGTVLLTFIMILFVVPVGVIAAIYLREYAKQGTLVSIIRICVNNLAGVPSIVFGVFGLGFFCYLIGGNIDQIFFAEKLPDPTFGKSAILWASLTLALLTLPVVIVATEEALAAVPRSMREGSYACGASKWQTMRRIVLPRAMPGVMTGMILAIARGAGEVAPLMLVGAVKLAPELPIAASISEQFGLNRSFMHLGFHIFDLGFQSRNSEAAKNMVYTTTGLLIFIVVMLNIAAIFIRSRLRRAHSGGAF